MPLIDSESLLKKFESGALLFQPDVRKIIEEEPEVHPEDYEWCTGCKEYDHERGCCPRFGKVIAETVDEVKQNLKVVYCKDCDNFTPGKDEWGACSENPMKMWRTTDFCSWGERRTDAIDRC